MYLKFKDQIQIGQWKIGFMIFKTTGVDIMTTGGQGMGLFDNIDHYDLI